MIFFRKIWRKFIIKFVLQDPETCTHEWEVYCVAINDRCLELQCNNCALVGAVYNLSDEEWERGLSAPSNPYIWEDHSRVKKGKFQLI